MKKIKNFGWRFLPQFPFALTINMNNSLIVSLHYALIAIIAISTIMYSCKNINDSTLIDEVNPNSFSDVEIKLLQPNTNGTPKSFTVDVKADNSRYDMPKAFRIDVEIGNLKTGDIKITPFINKIPIELSLANAYEDDKDQYGPKVNIALVIKRTDGSTYSPTSTLGILLKDDNNPSTVDPPIAELPNSFTFDEFIKYNANVTATKSYSINKNDELQIWVETRKVNKQFVNVKIPLNIIQQLTLANNGK